MSKDMVEGAVLLRYKNDVIDRAKVLRTHRDCRRSWCRASRSGRRELIGGGRRGTHLHGTVRRLVADPADGNAGGVRILPGQGGPLPFRDLRFIRSTRHVDS